MLVAWLITPGNQRLAGRQLHALPHRPFVLVARIGLLDAVVADLHLQHQVDDVLQRHVEGVRAVPASPADVIARALLGDAAQRVVERVDAKLRPGAVLRLASSAAPSSRTCRAGRRRRSARRGRHRRSPGIPGAGSRRARTGRPSRRRSARSWRRAARLPAPPPAGTRRCALAFAAAAFRLAMSRFDLRRRYR